MYREPTRGLFFIQIFKKEGKQMAEQLNIYQKLAKIRKMTEVIVKNKKGFNYKYTSIDEILR